MVFYATRENIVEISRQLVGKTLWIPILSDNSAHYIQNRITAIYIYSFETEDEYLIGFHANDLDTINIEYFFGIIPTGHRIVYNAKYFSVFDFECVDADLLIWYYTSNSISVDQNASKIFNIYRGRYSGMNNINDVIPIMRILDYCRDIRNRFIEHYVVPDDDGYLFYETIYRKNLLKLEHSGIHIDLKRFREFSGKAIVGGTIYSEYNPYTATGRPSNSSCGINLNSLNKTDGSRKIIVSGFDGGRLVEYDYDSYHLRLIGNMIGYQFPPGNVHEFLGKQYFKFLKAF